jgi:hypothetical protein
MGTQVQSDARISALTASRRMVLIWQHPTSRKFLKVGLLDKQADGTFVFRYLPGAGETDGFAPLMQFPDVNAEYRSGHLPAFFANRVMSSRRASYREFLGWLGIRDGDDVPIDILLRTGGPRATDTFHIAAESCTAVKPSPNRDARCRSAS